MNDEFLEQENIDETTICFSLLFFLSEIVHNQLQYSITNKRYKKKKERIIMGVIIIMITLEYSVIRTDVIFDRHSSREKGILLNTINSSDD